MRRTSAAQLWTVRREGRRLVHRDLAAAVGISWGGMLALAYLLTQPAGVRSAVLASAHHRRSHGLLVGSEDPAPAALTTPGRGALAATRVKARVHPRDRGVGRREHLDALRRPGTLA
jgi:pimeloyl-ACP methyl ester carboxylesterase